MADPNVLNPHPPEFERFLYAPVGEDRNGYVVTVLSALARLGLDPWVETEELITSGRAAARTRLATLLSRCRDVPALADEATRVARDLTQLLPDARPSGHVTRATAPLTAGRFGTGGMILAALTILIVLFQVFVVGGVGAGH